MTLFGLAAGVWLWSPEKKYRRREGGPTRVPFAGWKRWHAMLGLVFGLTAFTWILTGMFSMNPFLWSPDLEADAQVAARFTGGPVNLETFDAGVPLDGDEKQVEFVQFQGRALVYAVRRHPHDTELRFVDGGRRSRS